MKNLILSMILGIVCAVFGNAQTTFYGSVSKKSEVIVQDLSTGIEQVFQTKKEIVVPLEYGHDYYISVKNSTTQKDFIVRRSADPWFLDDSYFNIDEAPGITMVAGLEDPFTEYYSHYPTYLVSTDNTLASGDHIDPGSDAGPCLHKGASQGH